MACEDCKRQKTTTGWSFGAVFAVVFGVASVLYQQINSVERQIGGHENLRWHPGAGEGIATANAAIAAIKEQTTDRFRRGEWSAWSAGNDKTMEDIQRRVILLELYVREQDKGLLK